MDPAGCAKVLSARGSHPRDRPAGGTRPARRHQPYNGPTMMAIVVVLVILWLLGIITKYTLGGLLHILLVIAIIFLLINVIRGRGL